MNLVTSPRTDIRPPSALRPHTISQYKSVRALIADAPGRERSRIATTLDELDVKTVKSTNSIFDLYTEAKRENVDLVVVDSDLDHHGLTRFVQDVRHGRVGANPFLSFFVLLGESACADTVRSFLASGVDAVFTRPLDLAHFNSKLFDQVYRRKPFAAGATYIGPERRKADRADETFAVPSITAFGDRRRINDTFQRIQSRRVALLAVRIAHHLSLPSPDTRIVSEKLAHLTSAILQALPYTEYVQAGGLYAGILGLVEGDQAISYPDLTLIRKAAYEGRRIICGIPCPPPKAEPDYFLPLQAG